MKKYIKLLNKIFFILIYGTLIIFSNITTGKTHTKISLSLDWTPNTNHTGLIVAKKLGYYAEEGLEINIIQPGKNSAELLTSRGFVDFAISTESSLIQAYLKEMPLISIATIISHNTSGFYSLKEKNITSPKDFEGKTYGSWGSKLESATIKAMMENIGADFSKVKIITIGNTDFFKAKNIDFVWGFEAWTGIKARVENIPVNYISIRNTINLDGYTPIIITNQNMLKKHPDIVYKFIKATAKGYNFSINNPQEAAKILLQEYPEIDPKLVIASQEYLATKYKDKNILWGYQNPKVWENYIQWMLDNKIINMSVDANKIFTNKFILVKQLKNN